MRFIIILLFLSFSASGQVALWHSHNQITACKALGIDTLPNIFYSFRKMNDCVQTNCIRLRRASDNVEQDFGFINNYLDTNAVKSFMGSSSVTAVRWYNQGSDGSVYDMSAPSNTAQPTLGSNGNLIYADGRLALNFDGSNDVLFVAQVWTNISYPTGLPYSFFSVSKRTNAGQIFDIAIIQLTNVAVSGLINASTHSVRAFYYNLSDALVGTPSTSLKFNAGFFTASNIIAYNGTLEASVATTGSHLADGMSIGAAYRGSPIYTAGMISEVVGYKNNQYLNRATISQNMISYYGL